MSAHGDTTTRSALRWAGASGILLLFALVTITRADPDLWGHLRFGLDLLHSHHLVSADPYSFTQDRAWINHEWLSELQMAVAYTLAGTAGLALLKGAVACITYLLIWSALRDVDFGARVIAFGAAAVGTAQLIHTLRPQLWTFVAMAVLWRVLVSGRVRALVWLPVLFAVWANLHGGWIVGLGMLVAWAAVDTIADPRVAGRWMLAAAACTLATLCTPYGLGLWRFLLSTVHMTRPMIEEWQPLWTLEPARWLVWAGAVGACAWLLARQYPNRWRAAVPLLLLAYASLRVARVVPLFVESAAIVLGPIIAARWPGRVQWRDRALARSERALLTGLALTACVAAIWIGSSSLRCIRIEPDPRMPDLQAARVLDHARNGRLVTFFNWGEYAIWRWGPKLRVSMDGRRETVYSDRRIAEHDAVLDGTREGFAVLDAWRAEYVWLPETSRATRTWLSGHGYRIDLQTARSFVAVRADLPRLEASPPVVVLPACFPG